MIILQTCDNTVKETCAQVKILSYISAILLLHTVIFLMSYTDASIQKWCWYISQKNIKSIEDSKQVLAKKEQELPLLKINTLLQ
jgi:hypothetical protein